jgi:CRP-like cAMP-binding protein
MLGIITLTGQIMRKRGPLPGAVIFREGDPTRSEAYLVHEGTVEARRIVDGEDRVLNTLGKGDLLGEVALFREGLHSVTAIAKDRVTVVVIPADRLEKSVANTSPSGSGCPGRGPQPAT